MKKRYGVALMILLALLLLPVRAAEADFEGYLVKLTKDAPRLLSADRAFDVLVVDTLEEALQIPEGFVEYIEPNYQVELFTNDGEVVLPSDPYYADYQWSIQYMSGLAAWNAGLTGEGVKVGFVDSGINRAHEDLNAQNIIGVNYNVDGLAYWQDSYGHGTFTAGVVAAQTDNGLGLAGLAPEAEIYAYRVFSEKDGDIAGVLAAIEQAMADGCRVLNLSFGTEKYSRSLHEAVAAAVDAGILVVAAVGNDGTATLQYPAAWEGVIGVGSVGPGGVLSSFSQRNTSVFVTAPGEQIAGLGNTASDQYLLDLTAATNNGTSFAAPVVTAMAAIALGYDEDITADGVRYLLEHTSVDGGDPGYDTSYGHGVVDMEAFLTELTRSFSLTYVLSGGSLPQDAPESYQATDEDLTLPIPTREGYWFDGWYTDEEYTQPITAVPAGSLGDVAVYAAWREAYNGLNGYADGVVSYGAQTDALVLLAAYDPFDRLQQAVVLEAPAGEGSVTATTLPEGEILRIFLMDRTAWTPLCLALEE